MSRFRPAPLAVYLEWLRLHLEAGGVLTHHYDYPFERARFLLATADFTTGGECGAQARTILLPAGIHHAGGQLGHNDLLGFDHPEGGDFVPTYSNPEFLALPGVAAHIAEQRRRDCEYRAQAARDQAAHDAAARASDLGRYVLGGSEQ